uniref:Uncharacterized protein n=1 Tax=Nelumbo nucifera TaxID=4432 RepID=A0A822Y5C5_NELNU|nr:TPA_asm: hypothetical protein HUJ06_028691 [Nelumbo nucifera]
MKLFGSFLSSLYSFGPHSGRKAICWIDGSRDVCAGPPARLHDAKSPPFTIEMPSDQMNYGGSFGIATCLVLWSTFQP